MLTKKTHGALKLAVLLIATFLASSNLAHAQDADGGDGLLAQDTSNWKRQTNWSSGPKANDAAKQQARNSARKRQARKNNRVARKNPRTRTAQTPQVPESVGGELLFVFEAGTSDQVIDEVGSEYGLTRVATADIALLNARVVKLEGTPGQLPDTLQRASGDNRIRSVHPNVLYTLAAANAAQYALAKLKLDTAKDIGDGSGVSIAVIDSGVRANHPAFEGHEIAEFDALGSGVGRADSHGTAIAGIIGARKGIQGIVPNATLLSARAFAYSRKLRRTIGETFHLLQGLDWAVGKGAQVLNLSFAGPADALMKAALSASHSKGVIAVAAAGNGGRKAPTAYPAGYENVIAVTATDHRDRLYRKANRGAYIQVSAPGVRIISANGAKGYRFTSGTSMAAAHVSAAVALLLQQNAALTPQDVASRLTGSARDLGKAGKDPEFGFGLLDIVKAMSAAN